MPLPCRVRAGDVRPLPPPARDGRRETWLLVLAVATTIVVLIAFALTTLSEEPLTAVALIAILLLGVVLDLWWKSRRGSPA